MTIELAPEEFAGVLPLYHATDLRFPLISAVLERRQRGQVFRDQRSALVVNNFGFMFYAGETSENFDTSLRGIFETASGIKPSYLLWYSPPAGWQQYLNERSARLRERVRFEFRGGSVREPVACPAGLEMRRLDAELIPKTKKFGLEIDSRFWSSARDFETNGLGYCILKDDEVVSVCYAAAISEQLAEVDVVTDEPFRGQGLAGIVSRQFIRECLAWEIRPTWDCFAYNTGSLRLAEKLGFAEVRRYPFYSFNLPIQMINHKDTKTRC